MNKLVIDGKTCTAEPGETLLAAARRADVEIPTLCFEPRLPAYGACRVCLVQVEKRGLVAACHTPANRGMVVTTENELLRGIRSEIFRLLLQDTPPDCPNCVDGRRCDLHRWAERYGVNGERRGTRSEGWDGAPFLRFSPSFCIACARCKRVCSDIQGVGALALTGRGSEPHVESAFGQNLRESSCEFCGQCIEACPTGAIMEWNAQEGRAADKLVDTICPYCGTGCGVTLHVRDEKIARVTARHDSPANRGALCVKGRFGWDFVSHEDRLRDPMIRKNGRFRSASWQEAYDCVAESFLRIKRESGPDALAGWSSGRAANEPNYLFQKFFRAAIGTNSVDNCART